MGLHFRILTTNVTQHETLIQVCYSQLNREGCSERRNRPEWSLWCLRPPFWCNCLLWFSPEPLSSQSSLAESKSWWLCFLVCLLLLCLCLRCFFLFFLSSLSSLSASDSELLSFLALLWVLDSSRSLLLESDFAFDAISSRCSHFKGASFFSSAFCFFASTSLRNCFWLSMGPTL